MKTGAIEHPTGFSPLALPFYGELDDGGFEQFCTDLLNLHPDVWCLRDTGAASRKILGANRLLSGTPQKGADIRAEAEQGEVWFFQCKRTKDFSPSKVREAIALAEKGFAQADQFVLVTACGLSEEAQREIHSRTKWRWWDAARLTTEVHKLVPREHAINLVHQYFGPEWARKLFPCSDQPLLTWQQFFDQDLSPARGYFHHRVGFVPWGDTLGKLKSFAKDGAGRALVLTASGGQGKSRLLLELARDLEKQPGAPRVRFLNLDRQGLTAEQKDFLAREEGELLLVVDDAHRLDTAIQDIARPTARASSVRLLVATRPQALEAVRSQLYQNGYSERLEEPLSLPRWKQADILALAEQLLEPHARLQAPRLADLADRCPLLVVLGSALANSGAWPDMIKDKEVFRERVFRSFKEDFLNREPENRRERLERLMRLISFVSPTPKNEALLNEAAEILNCSPLDVEDDLELLSKAGMLVENREGVRLYPDLFADAVLLDASLDHNGQASALCRAILTKLSITDFPALMRNLAQADWEDRTKRGAQSSLFEPLWQEFARRFEAAKWHNYGSGLSEWIMENYRDGKRKTEPDREELLEKWASFAVFLPERTLELAELALRIAESPGPDDEAKDAPQVRASLSAKLPGLLKPIAIWHHTHARRALEMLWSLDADEPRKNFTDNSNAIAAIAEVADLGVQKPLKTSLLVVEWLQEKLDQPAAVERLHRQPWILGALLKPFFGREVEHNWSSGRTFHLARLPVAVDKTRPLRQKALQIAEKFLDSSKIDLAYAVVPVIKEAIHPLLGGFGSMPTEADHLAWRPDRLEVLKVIEKGLETHRSSPIMLLKLRRVLWNRLEYDPDEVVREECRRVYENCPDTFELRVVRALSSWAQHEISIRSGPNHDSDFSEAEREWMGFRRTVARQVTAQFNAAKEIREFISKQVQELTSAHSPIFGGALLDAIIEASPVLSSTLLKELLNTADKTLDGFLWPVINQAAIRAKESYQEALEFLSAQGRSEQVCSLINYLGWKQYHGGGLSLQERRTVINTTARTEEIIVTNLASVAGLHFAKEPSLGMDVLLHLKPSNGRAGGEVLEALSHLVEKDAKALGATDVALVLANVGEFCFPETTSDERHLDIVGKAFPQQVYEQTLGLHERAEANPSEHSLRGFAEEISLGPINDQAYLDREIQKLWQKAIVVETDSFSQRFRIALIRSLLGADTVRAQARMQNLVNGCTTAEEIKAVAKILAPTGSRFVFTFPDIARMVLTQAKNLSSHTDVERTLWRSACGGGHSFSGNELDPEYRYILEEGDALANRYRDDAILGPFYRSIANSERESIEQNKLHFRDDDE